MKRLNALLVEIMIAVLFFGLCSTVILQTYVSAHEQSVRAGTYNTLLLEAQNTADILYAAEDETAALGSLGFSETEEGWTREVSGCTLIVTIEYEPTEAGSLRCATVTGGRNGETLITLPSARYLPGEVSE